MVQSCTFKNNHPMAIERQVFYLAYIIDHSQTNYKYVIIVMLVDS